MMLLKVAQWFFTREHKVPEFYKRMMRAEFRTVPVEYVEYFLEQNNRLPTNEELKNAI